MAKKKNNTKLLSMIRELNDLLSESYEGYVSFDDLCKVTGDMLKSNVYVISKKGKILASVVGDDYHKNVVIEKEEEQVFERENIALIRLAFDF